MHEWCHHCLAEPSTVNLTCASHHSQRVAWALAQIFVIGEGGVPQTNDIEDIVTYYDIFVRHAFGNIRDIIQEMSWSGLMGYYLTYLNSQSHAVSGSAADENYARELMQVRGSKNIIYVS